MNPLSSSSLTNSSRMKRRGSNLAASGRLLEAKVHRSSGHGVLDRQALAMAANAERFPPPPDGLGEREVEVLVPVVFRLER